MTNKVSVQYTFPFRVRRWETLRHGLLGFMDEHGSELMPRLAEIQRAVDDLGAEEPLVVFDAFEGSLGASVTTESRRVSLADTDASVKSAIKTYIGNDARSANHLFQVSRDPVSYELLDVLNEFEAEAPERLMRFLRDRLDEGGLPLLRPTRLHLGDDRGTRAYIERRRPFIEAKIRGCDFTLLNAEVLPDLRQKLPTDADGLPRVRLTATVVLMGSGFGCVAMEARLLTRQGLQQWVDEIIYQAGGIEKGSRRAAAVATAKDTLSDAIDPLVDIAIETRDPAVFDEVLETGRNILDIEFIRTRLASLVNGATVVSDDLSTEDLVDLANLDRGCSRGEEPHFEWEFEGETHTGRMTEYYHFVVDALVLRRLGSSIAAYEPLRQFMARPERRKERAVALQRYRSEIKAGIGRMSRDISLGVLDEHPYVSTFLSAPKRFRAQDERSVAERFSEALTEFQPELVRILMKSKWAAISQGWAEKRGVLENLFYSDLIYMAVDIRSTICVYYMPSCAEEYAAYPELAHGYKYLVELNETLQEQRILWYAYTYYDSVITQDLRTISSALEGLKEDTLHERFNEVIEGLTEVIRGIDRKKMALAETMHDPLSRKAGSSVFAQLIERTNEAFQLDTLYRDLSNKLERLEMVGLHVAETVQQYTSLVLQEGTRSAQLTLEFLEAFIIAFYFAELVHLSYPEAQKELIFPLAQWWSFYALTLGIFLSVLPAITLIRRSRSRIAFNNPPWLDKLERAGMFFGPAILLTLVYLGGAMVPEGGHEAVFHLAKNAMPGLIGVGVAYVAIVAVWRAIERRVEAAV